MSLNLSPYLNFNGTCEEAMNFYKSVLGGDLELTRFKDMPMPSDDSGNPEGVMNSTLKTPDITFMASDAGMAPVTMGGSINLALSGGPEDETKLRGFFDGLSEGGIMTMPLADVPWGAVFGMFTDKFGTQWMINIANEAPTA